MPFPCDIPGCSEVLKTKKTLKKHQLRCRNDRQYRCDICPDARFNVKEALVEHYKTTKHANQLALNAPDNPARAADDVYLPPNPVAVGDLPEQVDDPVEYPREDELPPQEELYDVINQLDESDDEIPPLTIRILPLLNRRLVNENIDLRERINTLESENLTRQQENTQLQKRNDELEKKLENKKKNYIYSDEMDDVDGGNASGIVRAQKRLVSYTDDSDSDLESPRTVINNRPTSPSIEPRPLMKNDPAFKKRK